MLKLASTGAGPAKPLRMAQFSPRRSVANCQRYLALRSKGPENCGEDAAFLRVPAVHGDEVDGLAAQVIVLRVDFLKWKPLKEEKQRFQLAVSESIALARAENHVEVAVAARIEIEVKWLKDARCREAARWSREIAAA